MFVQIVFISDTTCQNLDSDIVVIGLLGFLKMKFTTHVPLGFGTKNITSHVSSILWLNNVWITNKCQFQLNYTLFFLVIQWIGFPAFRNLSSWKQNEQTTQVAIFVFFVSYEYLMRLIKMSDVSEVYWRAFHPRPLDSFVIVILLTYYPPFLSLTAFSKTDSSPLSAQVIARTFWNSAASKWFSPIWLLPPTEKWKWQREDQYVFVKGFKVCERRLGPGVCCFGRGLVIMLPDIYPHGAGASVFIYFS